MLGLKLNHVSKRDPCSYFAVADWRLLPTNMAEASTFGIGKHLEYSLIGSTKEEEEKTVNLKLGIFIILWRPFIALVAYHRPGQGDKVNVAIPITTSHRLVESIGGDVPSFMGVDFTS